MQILVYKSTDIYVSDLCRFTLKVDCFIYLKKRS